jgi:hypothetical protein
VTSLDRIAGEHWLFDLQVKLDGPSLEMNELGQINSADGIEPARASPIARRGRGRLFRSYSVNLGQMHEWTFGWERQAGDVHRAPQRDLAELLDLAFSFTFTPAHQQRVADPRRSADGRAARAGAPSSTSATRRRPRRGGRAARRCPATSWAAARRRST